MFFQSIKPYHVTGGLRRLSQLCFIGAAFIVIYVVFMTCHRWTVLKRAVRVEDNYSFSQTFTVDRSEIYEIYFKCQKTIPDDMLDDILMHQLAATYSVYDEAKLVADDHFPNQSGAVWGSDAIYRGIGRFAAVPFHTYRLNVRFTRSFPDLLSTEPTILVRISVSRENDTFTGTIILIMLMLVLALFGSLLKLAGRKAGEGN